MIFYSYIYNNIFSTICLRLNYIYYLRLTINHQKALFHQHLDVYFERKLLPMSSANWNINSFISGRPWTYRFNDVGPKTDPRGSKLLTFLHMWIKNNINCKEIKSTLNIRVHKLWLTITLTWVCGYRYLL